MKISSIKFKDLNNKIKIIKIENNGQIPLDFFVYGKHGSGKTKLCNTIWKCWQSNVFHAENSKLINDEIDFCEISGNFHDNSPFSISLPSKMSNKLIINSKSKFDQELKNTILYYPSNRFDCVDSRFSMGSKITSMAMPLADLQDSSISNCCFLIDDAFSGLEEQDIMHYGRELINSAKLNNNQIIMLLDPLSHRHLSIKDKIYEIKNEDYERSTFDKIIELSNLMKKSRN